MSEKIPKERFPIRHVDGITRYIIFCTTCIKPLMQTDMDPDQNPVLKRVARGVSRDHKAAYHRPHVVEIIDSKNRTSSTT